MSTEKKLNLDIAGAITEFEAYMKEFALQRILYKIIFRGKGLEFDSYRDYNPDDDASDIDWKASVKAKRPLIKKYIEERDLKIMFIIDVSDNMLFGSTEKLKCEYAAEISAALAYLMLNYGDNIGFIFFSEKIITEALPKKGRHQFDVFVSELSNPDNYGGPSKMSKIMDFLIGYLDKSINALILVSDFLSIDESSYKTFNFLSNKFETIALIVKDPLDSRMPKIKGEIVIQDPSTNKQVLIDPSIIANKYEMNALEHDKIVKKILSDSSIDFIDLTTDKKFSPLLAEFLRSRVEKRRYIVPK